MAFSLHLSIFAFLPVRYVTPMFTISNFKMMFGLIIIGNIAATTLIFVYKS